jgi:hypothetical protein
LEDKREKERERDQEKALWYMQRLGPRIKARQRQLMTEDIEEELRVTPFKQEKPPKEA